jgi:pimeloyl-ACP methyl ester carboxylesterase
MQTVTSRDGTSIAFDRIGTGPPLVLVGGALEYRAIDARTAQLAELLAAEFAVYHYDRRGRGASADKAPYDIDREIDDLDALIEHAGELAVVFGNSSGAVLALRAAYAGVAIRKLALYEPPFIVDDSRTPVPADYLCRLTEFAEAERRGDAVAYFMTEAVGLPDELVTAMREEPFWPAFEAVAHTLAYDAAVMADTSSGSPTPLQQWSTLNVATLVLDGSKSPPHQHNACDLLAATLSRTERRTLAGQSHEVDPDVLAPVLVEFFRTGSRVPADSIDRWDFARARKMQCPAGQEIVAT